MTAEEWRPVPGFPGYEVSNQGRVLSRKGRVPRELRGGLVGKGYRAVSLRTPGGESVSRKVHLLVAEAFHGPRPAGAQARHLDGDKAHNTANNIRWGTPSENARDKVVHGTHNNARKTHCPRQHPYDEANTYARGGRRECRACGRERHAARLAAQPAPGSRGAEGNPRGPVLDNRKPRPSTSDRIGTRPSQKGIVMQPLPLDLAAVADVLRAQAQQRATRRVRQMSRAAR